MTERDHMNTTITKPGQRFIDKGRGMLERDDSPIRNRADATPLHTAPIGSLGTAPPSAPATRAAPQPSADVRIAGAIALASKNEAAALVKDIVETQQRRQEEDEIDAMCRGAVGDGYVDIESLDEMSDAQKAFSEKNTSASRIQRAAHVAHDDMSDIHSMLPALEHIEKFDDGGEE
jgi:hypothetical protein